jgi:hypothetical protein
MATIVPSNAVVAMLWSTRNFKRLRELEVDGDRRDLEDYRTVSTERGPVRGYER